MTFNVKEYDIFNEIYPFYGKHYIGSKNNKEAKILLHELHNVSKEEISYVKLTNLDLWCNINDNKWVTVIEDYEIEVYAE